MTFTRDIVANYSCPTDGTSDCRAAFLAWKADAQGLDSVLNVPAHTYTFKAGGSSQFPFDGIPTLIVEATGATFTDDAGAGGISYGTSVGINNASPQSSARIQTVFAGHSTVTLKTLADYSIFTVGRWIVISAYDLQGGGSSPPNLHYCEFAKVAAINSGTGVITLQAPLAYDYISTFSVYDPGSAGQPDCGGPATIYVLPAKWDTEIEFRGLTINTTNGGLFAKGKSIKFLNCSVTGGASASILPTVNKTWTVSGPSSNFPIVSEFDKIIDTVVIENGAFFNQPFLQSSAPNTLIIDGATITTLNGTPKNTIVRNGAIIGVVKLGTQYYGRTDSFQASDSTISAVTYSPPQDLVSSFPSISNGGITKSGPVVWGMPGTHLIITGQYFNEAGPVVLTNTNVSGTTSLIQTNLAAGWPGVPGTLKVGAHPCPRVRVTNCTGCADIVDLSQAGAYDRPLYSYTKRTYNGLVGAATAHQIWGRPTSIIVNVTSAAAGTLLVFGQADNYPVIKADYTTTTYAPHVDLSVAGIHTLTGAETYWFTGNITPWCTSTTAVFSIEIVTDQGFPPPITVSNINVSRHYPHHGGH